GTATRRNSFPGSSSGFVSIPSATSGSHDAWRTTTHTRTGSWSTSSSLHGLTTCGFFARRCGSSGSRHWRGSLPPPPPAPPPPHLDTLRQTTTGYPRRDNLTRIKELGGGARRGVLLAGPPGNGKTSACRWLWELCHELRYEFRLVSPDVYRAARASCNPPEAVKALFAVSRRGIVFFDDMDIALRDRALSPETDDQAVFLRPI